MKSKLETIRFVKEFLLKQGTRSRDDGGCTYRGPNGTKCAIGCLIPDEKYTPSWERCGIMGNEGSYKAQAMLDAVRDAGFDIDFRLAAELQDIHDSYEVEAWPSRFERLEAEYAQ